jgi:hypothetical protein
MGEAMRWIVDRDVAMQAGAGVTWLKEFLGGFDLSRVDWVRVDRGRMGAGGAYGRCWYPEGRRKGFRLSLQVPGPFPHQMLVRRRPIYVVDGVRSRELLPGEYEGEHVLDNKGGVQKAWIRVRARVPLGSIDEAVVWVGAHEAFHFLRRSRQIPGRNGEIEADAYADGKLAEWKANPAARLHGIWSGLPRHALKAIEEERA